MAGRRARCSALTLLVCLALPLLLPGWSALFPDRAFAAPGPDTPAATGDGPPTPLVLVPGAGGDCVATYGVPPVRQDGRGGVEGRRLYRFLLGRGYRRDDSLFWVDLPDTASRSLGALVREHLLPVLDRARRGSTTGRVNVVTYGYGGLLLRHYLESPGYRGDIDTAVLVAPPHHGSQAASLARLGAEVHRHARAPRPGPAQLAAWSGRREEFGDAFSWVQKRAALVYEPLCREYIAERSGGGTGGRHDPGRSFEAWLMVRRPQLWRRSLAVPDPPLPPLPIPRQGSEEQDLSRGWFDLVALSLARYRLVRAGAGQEPLLTYLCRDGHFTTDWRQMALHYLQRLAVYLADRLWNIWCDRGDEWLAGAGARTSGIDPRGSASRAMLSEELAAVVPPPGDDPRGNVAGLVPVNALLRRWNAVGPARRPEGVRMVTVAGCCVDLWRLLGRSPGGNDLWLEVRSTWIPPGRDDVFRLFRGLVAGNHAWLLSDERVFAFILTELRGPRPWRSLRLGPAPGEGGIHLPGRAEVFRPTYLRLEGPSRGRPRLRVTLIPSATPPPGLRLSAWAWLGSRGGGQLVRGVVDGRCVTLTLPAPGERWPEVEVGFRLEAPDGGPGDLERLLDQRPIPVTVVVEPLPPGGAPPGGVAPPDAPPPGGSPADPGAPGGPEPPGDPAVPGDPGGPDDSADIPLILVQRRTKRTTLKREKLPGHVRWEWSFGDGAAWRDSDPDHLESRVEHDYETEGRYAVTARSVDESGRLLVERTWDVVVGAGEAPLNRTFIAETVRPPRVDISLEGPRSWITGRPADFVVRAAVAPPPYSVRQEVTFDPGERFRVLWERPGEYVVGAAVTVKTKYHIAGRDLTLRRTYLVRTGVEVRATSLVE